MRDMYRLCATERLFIPDMFPDMEKAIFMDTDLAFERHQLGEEDPSQLLADIVTKLPKVSLPWLVSGSR